MMCSLLVCLVMVCSCVRKRVLIVFVGRLSICDVVIMVV